MPYKDLVKVHNVAVMKILNVPSLVGSGMKCCKVGKEQFNPSGLF
jgi:hypothetical protein